MTFSQRNTILPIILLILGLLLGYNFALDIQKINTHPLSTSTSATITSVFDTEKVQETIKLIQNKAYGFDKKTKTDIEDSVIKAVVSGLGDKYSTYFTPKEASQFQEALLGDFEGIGAVIDEAPRGIQIRKIIENSPAKKAGLQAGDVMIRVGDKSLVGETTENAIAVIRGPKGSTVHIAYLRGEDEKEYGVDVTRDVVNIPSVAEKVLDNKIGYIEVATFGEHTSDEFIKSWNSLTASGVRGIIIDFRNNGGGFLETAIDLASVVLPKHTSVVITKENNPLKNNTEYTKENARSNTTIPLVILVNGFSASASEIFAGALQDHSRAIILGEKTYGKSSVQEPFSLGDGSMVKLTTARWYTPNGDTIDEKGITPDIKVYLTQKDYTDIFDRQKKVAETLLEDMIANSGSVESTIKKYKEQDFSKIIP